MKRNDRYFNPFYEELLAQVVAPAMNGLPTSHKSTDTKSTTTMNSILHSIHGSDAPWTSVSINLAIIMALTFAR
jgi:hypothetical protein